MQLLKGKCALVTGGTSGIGREIALTFAQAGADVVIFGTSEERGREVVDLMKNGHENQKFHFINVDVANKTSVDTAVAHTLTFLGRVDVLVNNAGITRDRLLMRMTEEDWDQVVDVNLKSVYNLCQSLSRPMLKAKAGKIINISSVVALMGNAGQTNYAASKAGMIGFTKAYALEMASRGICVNCIAPGFIVTRMTDALSEAQTEELLKKIPMGRLGTPQDIAHAALFLASSLSDYMTGQVVTVDGGMVMH